MPIESTLPEYYAITLTEEATNRLLNIFNKGKTPIIKANNLIYHPIEIGESHYTFLNYSNNKLLDIYPYGYTEPINM